MNPSPTDPVAVEEWMKSLDFRWSQGGYWVSDTNGLIAPDQAAFFYNVVQQQMVEARLDEQLSTGTLRFKPDKDGDYGAVYYFVPGEDTVKPQQDRIAELEATLKEQVKPKHGPISPAANKISNCHNAPVVLCEGTAWDVPAESIRDGSTYYYGCTECHETCLVHFAKLEASGEEKSNAV